MFAPPRIACALFHAGSSRGKPGTLRAGTNLWPGYEPFYLDTGMKENPAMLSGSDPAFLIGAKTLAKALKDINLLRVDIDPSRLADQSVIRRIAP